MSIRKARITLAAAGVVFGFGLASGQGMRTSLNASGSEYLQWTWLNQVWVRADQSNPGSAVNATPKDWTTDIGLRRTRMQLFGQIAPRVFFYTQLGMNNVNALSPGNGGNRKNQFFIHDAVMERRLSAKNQLKVGGGLTILNGLSRFSQPSIGTIATLDVPVFAQATVDQTDQFSRKLSVYARGQIARLDYRVAVTTPFAYASSGAATGISAHSTFNPKAATKQFQGFFVWNFAEKEPHTTPYMTGTYLGTKRILNLELGAIHQANAMWSLQAGDTALHPLDLASIAVFAEQPYGSRRAAFSGYLGYFKTNYGPGYLRTNGIMNPANSSVNPAASLGGYGNAYPMFSTGSSWYGQAAWVSPDRGSERIRVQPYVSARVAHSDRLERPMWITNLGVNLLEQGHRSKLSLDWGTRPVYGGTTPDGLWQSTGRRNEFTLQYQVFIP
ncbi:MAG: hypothetical protein ACO28T_03965 [Schleiferiaceae bacterium]